MLFSTRHLYAQPSVDWFAYYRYLHRHCRALDRNWREATPQSVTVLEGHTSLVTSLELSLWTLVTASIDSTVRVWNLRTMECIQLLRCKHSITCVTQALIIWDIKTGQVVLQDNDACPLIASWMYMDERYIGYGATDGSVTIFDWSSRSELKIAGFYQEHTGDIIYVSILNMEIVMSAGTNGEILLYSLAKRRIIGRFLLPGAAQAVPSTPTICGNKVMFSTQDAIYEYELDIQDIVSSFNQENQREEEKKMETNKQQPQQCLKNSKITFSSSKSLLPSTPSSSSPSPSSSGPSSRYWKPSNSLLSQIREKIGPAKLMALSLGGETEPSPLHSTFSAPPSILSSSSSSSSTSSLASSSPSSATSASSSSSSLSSSSSSPSPSSSFAPLSSTYRTASSLTPTAGTTTKPLTTASVSLPTITTTTAATIMTTPARTIPTRFPQSTGLYYLPPGSRVLDHGTTSARLSVGVFMRQGCDMLSEMAVYTGTGEGGKEKKKLRTWSGAAVDRMLRTAPRSHYYTTMECNEHCAVITSGEKVYVVSFLPTGI
ncbi:hypothetical protein DFQ27_007809 [Actinomortierella ambigua]|uniref:Uncharacterized protein n=1 Tax=Actinomortierella ambigua TaxID=1343610 RepID=A0A9P6TZ73_9FUNG|nr:hypothetical protein DFQ27_007809 [Actinomortierella ambigua]